jgi:hypothetical protein
MSDRVIREGFPEGWFVQDRIKSGEALLCRPHFTFGSTCVCLRPGAITTDEWIPTARRIAAALAEAARADVDLVTVPRTPTPEMVEVICQAHTQCQWPGDFDRTAQAIRREDARIGYERAVTIAEATKRKQAKSASATPSASSWTKRFKGSERGGAYIHTHPDVDRAIVENHNGITYAGHSYVSLDAAKAAALNGIVS